VVFAAASIRGWRSITLGIGGLALGIAASQPALAGPAWAAVPAGLIAILGLARPRHWWLTSMAAGALAGLWSTLLQRQGVPLPAAIAAAAALPALAAWLACHRPRFAPPPIRDEALLVTFVVAMAVAVAPGVLDGWNAALALNVSAEAAPSAVPGWTLGLGCASLVLGALYSTWSRR
jgi:hypothetical protein